MHRVLTIARNTLADIFRRKVIYVGIAVTLMFELPSIATYVQSHTLSSAEMMLLAVLRLNGTISLFENWSRASIFMSAALGSVVLSWEVQGWTILTVLSRPVRRTEFLLAKWLGVLVFSLVFLGVGIAIGYLYAWDLEVQVLPFFKVAVIATVVSIICFSAVSLALSIFLSPVTASVVTIFMVFAPDLIRILFDHRLAIVRWLATAVYYIIPAGMPVNLVNNSFGKMMLNPDYGLYARVISENLLYGLFVFIAACAIFARREIRAGS